VRYPLSVAQEGAWVAHKTAPHGAASNIPLLSELAGDLDEDALRRAVELVVARHDVLRTRYRVGEDGLRAEVHPADDGTAMRTVDAPEGAQQVIEEEIWRPFDLRNGVFRCCLIRVSPRDHRFLLVIHQIAVDHTSLGILMAEISTAYNACRGGAEPVLPPVATQYGAFASWQRDWLSTDTVRDELGVWARELAAQPAQFDLPGDRHRPAVRTGCGEVVTGELTPAVTARLETLAQARGVTLFDFLTAAWQVVLARYSGQKHFLLGTSLPARPRAETERSIGLFCNQVPVVADTTGDPTFAELAERVHRAVEHAAARQHLPFASVVNAIGLKFDPSRTPLTQVSFDLRDTAPWVPRLDGVEATDVFVEVPGARMELALCCYTTDAGGLSVQAEFATDLFDGATVDRIVAAFIAAAADATDHPERRLSTLDLLGVRERRRVTQEWNATSAPYVDDITLAAAFEEQVQRTPELTAVRYADERLSYAQLNERANRLAHFLREHGVGPEVTVGLRLPRSPDLIVAMLAVAKAGGAYVPLDPNDPVDRHAFVLRDTGTRVLIADEASRDHVPLAAGGRTIALDTEWPEIAARPAENPPRAAGPLNLVYVIYTSGSTGKPKGVCITHRGLLNYITACMSGYAGAGDGGAPLFSSLAFDMVVPNIFTPLLMGQALYVVPPCAQAEIGPYLLRGAPYSFIKMTPGHLALLRSQLNPEDASRLAPVLVVGADFFPAHLYTSWREVDTESRVLNEYGPTEITVANTFGEIDEKAVRSRGVVPIGRPMANTTAYVLDTRMEPVPVGVIGELCVGGDGVARGYWGQAGLTAERFVPDSFGATPGGRLYRTGDLVRHLPSGELMFVGRLDDQVKVKGYRIEPREVEECLASHDDVEQAVVVADTDAVGERRLVGYLLAREGAALPEAGELKAFCRERLPEYMIPAEFARVDRMPLNTNGKLDRTALPPLSESRIGSGGVRVAPRDDVERAIAAIWSELLGVDVGTADNYFGLGAHSLMALAALEKVNSAFDVEVPVGDLFNHPTVGELAGFVKALLSAEGNVARFS
jgi:amino acid adenylation domain-containing protein